MAADKLPYWLQSGFTCSQSTVNWQSSLSSSVGQWLHACQTASIIKAAFLTKPPVRTEIARRAFSQAAPIIWYDLPLDSRSTVTHEVFRSATMKHFYELTFMNWSRSHELMTAPMIRFLTTYGALSNTLNYNHIIQNVSIKTVPLHISS